MSDFSLRKLAREGTSEDAGDEGMAVIIHEDQNLEQYSEFLFGVLERSYFIRGNNPSRPRGILSEIILPNAARVNDERPYTLGYIATGVRGHFPIDGTVDKLISLIYTLDARYRKHGAFIVSHDVMLTVKRLRDNGGHRIWEPAMAVGQPEMLFGYPVYESADMPLMPEGSFSAMFGDFFAAYQILDGPVRYERNKKERTIIARKQVDGYVKNFNAIKLLKFAEE